MIDETDAPLLLALIVACTVLMRPALPDLLRYAAVSAMLGMVARFAVTGRSGIAEARRVARHAVAALRRRCQRTDG